MITEKQKTGRLALTRGKGEHVELILAGETIAKIIVRGFRKIPTGPAAVLAIRCPLQVRIMVGNESDSGGNRRTAGRRLGYKVTARSQGEQVELVAPDGQSIAKVEVHEFKRSPSGRQVVLTFVCPKEIKILRGELCLEK